MDLPFLLLVSNTLQTSQWSSPYKHVTPPPPSRQSWICHWVHLLESYKNPEMRSLNNKNHINSCALLIPVGGQMAVVSKWDNIILRGSFNYKNRITSSSDQIFAYKEHTLSIKQSLTSE